MKQVKTHISDALWERMQRVRAHYDFVSDYELARASLIVCISMLERRMHAEGEGDTLHPELDELFRDLSEYELSQLGRRRGKSKDEAYYQLLFPTPSSEGVGEASACRQSSHVDIEKECLPRSGAGVHDPLCGWYDRFVARHYLSLKRRIERLGDEPRKSDGYTPMDIFHDTLMRLRERPTTATTYEEWEAIALRSFSPS